MENNNLSNKIITNRILIKKNKTIKSIKKTKKITKVKTNKLIKKRKSKYNLKTKRKQIPSKRPFLFNPNNPRTSFDVYIDKDPSDTIPIKYTTVKDVKDTINKLERLYKQGKYPHKRIWQVGMILKVRLGAMKKYKKTKYPNAKFVNERYSLAEKYFKFLGQRTKIKGDEARKKFTFNN
tara:strand:+ start:3275 stop:3811 length:537 start_codon:yes stop_codon:yes gene_type:complete